MSLTRRHFLQAVGASVALAATRSSYAETTRVNQITLLHTNDTHSRLTPIEAGPLKGQGGIARRAALVQEVRATQPATLVVDAGDVFQGTPYFNAFKGKADYACMSAAGYDLATLGNHDFDGSVDGLVDAMSEATFGFICANLRITDARLAARVQPHVLKTVGGRKLGFLGLTVAFAGLVPDRLHIGVEWLNPIPAAQAAVAALRDQGAEVIIALSHLGLDGRQGDLTLAAAVDGLDLIIGGHSHTFLDTPKQVARPDGRETAIVQVGSMGTHLGRVDLHFSGDKLAAVRGVALSLA